MVCHHPCVSRNNTKICCEVTEDKIIICEKTAGLRRGNSSDLKSACSKVVFPVEIFQFQEMHNESYFLATFLGHSRRPTRLFFILLKSHNSKV